MNKDIIQVPSAITASMFLSKFGLKLQQERLRMERERTHMLWVASHQSGALREVFAIHLINIY